MKKALAAVLLAVFLLSLPPPRRLAAQVTGPADSAPPIPASEYPRWARDLRRGEIVAFGSFPFTFFLATTVYETWKWGSIDGFSWDQRRYAPWPVKPAGAERLDNDEFLMMMGIAAGSAVLIAIIDHIIVRVRRSREARAAAAAQGEVRTIRSPWPPGSTPPGGEESAETPEAGTGEGAERGEGEENTGGPEGQETG